MKIPICLLFEPLIFVIVGFCGCSEKTPFNENTYITESEWPKAFADVARQAKHEGLKIDSFRVSRVYAAEYFLECESSKQLLEFLTVQWELSKVDKNDRGVKSFTDLLPRKFRSTKFDCYLSAKSIARTGDDGDYFCVIDEGPGRRLLIKYRELGTHF